MFWIKIVVAKILVECWWNALWRCWRHICVKYDYWLGCGHSKGGKWVRIWAFCCFPVFFATTSSSSLLNCCIFIHITIFLFYFTLLITKLLVILAISVHHHIIIIIATIIFCCGKKKHVLLQAYNVICCPNLPPFVIL